MSEEWMNQKKRKRERDLVLEDKLWGALFVILLVSGMIALNMYLHGYRFGL